MSMDSKKEYTEEDRKFWRETVLPSLDQLESRYKDNEQFALLNMAIRNRQFLRISDFNLMVDGVSLRISPEETKASIQAKLHDFLDQLSEQETDEERYTDEDRAFWREKVIPTLDALRPTYQRDPGFKLLSMMIEKRMLTSSAAESGLDMTIAGIRLKIGAKTKKVDIQKKLDETLQALRRKESKTIETS